MRKFIPLSVPFVSDNVIEEITKVLKSGWIATGPLTQKFEQKLSEYFDGRAALCFSSATSGLQAALIAIGIKPGDEVITTSMTFVAAANAISMLGAKPIFVDIDHETFNIDASKILDACTEKTKAIMPVHYAGIPVDLEAIYKIAKEKKLRVIEDAAHAMGASYKGKKIGAFGDIQVFSFHPIKNMTTGEGGCVVTGQSAQTERKILELQRFHGIDRSIWDRFSKNASSYYDVIFPGSKGNMSDLQSAIGIHQLDELESMNTRRRKLLQRYREAFSDIYKDFRIQKNPNYDFIHSGHLCAAYLSDPTKRDDFMTYLKEKSIGSTLYYMPIHLFSYYKNTFGYKDGDLHCTEYIGERCVCLPLYPSLSSEDQEYVIDTIRGYFK